MHMLNAQARVLLVYQHGREVAPMTQEGSLYHVHAGRCMYTPHARSLLIGEFLLKKK